jgi:hypothetical protein
MEARDALSKIEAGDKIKVEGFSQTFTATKVMFDGEMVDVEGPRGGEKSLVQNVNSGIVRMTNGGKNEGVISDIEVLQ